MYAKLFPASLLLASVFLVACQSDIDADYLIKGGHVYLGDNTESIAVDIAVQGENIVFIGTPSKHINAETILDVSGLIVAPGFIDPHTHSLSDLQSGEAPRRENANYRLQGVTTVFNGNDGYGSANITELSQGLLDNGIGSNTAFFVGHGAVRRKIMGNDDRAPSQDELESMKVLIAEAMEEGALGLSTGLFYAPGSFSDTDEIVELAKIAAAKGGVYESHIRDESTYNIGLEASIEEVLEIGRRANIPVHIAHIKALGVDVWGKSTPIIETIEKARADGLVVTADQYPWPASGTRISNALIPRRLKAGGVEKYMARLNDPVLHEPLKLDVAENLRRRGGAEAVLITDKNSQWRGKTLGEISRLNKLTPTDMAIQIARDGDAKIASFNMSEDDITNFMVQDWVMTSSDGDQGHPRKYASFPRKFEIYVRGQNIMPIETFLYKSSGLVADTFNICERGYLKAGYKADIVIFNPETFKAKADFQNPEILSEGVKYLFVNGTLAVEDGQSNSSLSGKVLKRCTHQ
ncbi:MAG: amidohydrolase [Alphaproteobacteria bacterium]|nr:MAG: amidohydrolase [Alphaproteobacteria bacterium]